MTPVHGDGIDMTVEQAAKLLQSHLKNSPWVTAVGVGETGNPAIVLYVKSMKSADVEFLKDGWKGFPVVVRKMGSPRLVASFSPPLSN
jgi:hypothetical protein